MIYNKKRRKYLQNSSSKKKKELKSTLINLLKNLKSMRALNCFSLVLLLLLCSPAFMLVVEESSNPPTLMKWRMREYKIKGRNNALSPKFIEIFKFFQEKNNPKNTEEQNPACKKF